MVENPQTACIKGSCLHLDINPLQPMGISGFCVFIIFTHALRLFVQLKLYRIIPVLILISIATQPGAGKAMAWKSIGLRAGMNDNRNNENFKQYEGFATWSLPWVWHPSLNWKIRTYLEANAGLLGGGGESAFVGSIGPGIYFTGFNEKIDISMGVNPTIISKHKFGDEDLGGPFAFTSHIGFILSFLPGISALDIACNTCPMAFYMMPIRG